MQNADNLQVTAVALEVAVLTYELTRRFPTAERYGLAIQMRRAAVSIGSNIAEGCGRAGNVALVAFLQIALGSASELEFQLKLAGQLEYGGDTLRDSLATELSRCKAMLSRLIAALRKRSADGKPGRR